MSITSTIVLYSVIWALLFYMINPLWQTSQSEDGEVTPGTPASAPVDPMIRRKAILTNRITEPSLLQPDAENATAMPGIATR